MPNAFVSEDKNNDETELEMLGLFCERGRGRSAWEAMNLCFEKGMPLPEWVLNYLKGTATKIEKESIRSQPLSLWRCLSMYREKSKQASSDNGLRRIYQRGKALRDLVNTCPAKTKTEAFEIVAKKVGLSPATVRDRYYKSG